MAKDASKSQNRRRIEVTTQTGRPKVTQEMIEGKARPPEGHVLKRVLHREFVYTNAVGNVVKVGEHYEHILVRIKSEGEAAAKPKSSSSRPDPSGQEGRTARPSEGRAREKERAAGAEVKARQALRVLRDAEGQALQILPKEEEKAPF